MITNQVVLSQFVTEELSLNTDVVKILLKQLERYISELKNFSQCSSSEEGALLQREAHKMRAAFTAFGCEDLVHNVILIESSAKKGDLEGANFHLLKAQEISSETLKMVQNEISLLIPGLVA